MFAIYPGALRRARLGGSGFFFAFSFFLLLDMKDAFRFMFELAGVKVDGWDGYSVSVHARVYNIEMPLSRPYRS